MDKGQGEGVTIGVIPQTTPAQHPLSKTFLRTVVRTSMK